MQGGLGCVFGELGCVFGEFDDNFEFFYYYPFTLYHQIVLLLFSKH